MYIYIIYFILYIIHTQEIHSSVLGDKAKCKHSALFTQRTISRYKIH